MRQLRLIVMLVASILLCVSLTQGQTRDVEYEMPFTVGWEGTPGNSDQQILQVTFINRSSSMTRFFQCGFMDQNRQFVYSLHLRSSSGIEYDTNFILGNISPRKNSTFTFSLNNSSVSPILYLQTTETWSTRLNRFVADVAIQVTIQRLDAQGQILSSLTQAPSGDVASIGTDFMAYAQLTTNTKTGISITNISNVPVTFSVNLYSLFDWAHLTPYAITTISLAPGQTRSGTIDEFFPNLPADDGGGGMITDGNLDIISPDLIAVTAYRIDSGLRSDMISFLGRASFSPKKCQCPWLKSRGCQKLCPPHKQVSF